MIEMISTDPADRVLRLRITGKIDREDLDAVSAELETRLNTHPKLRIYAEIEELKGMSLRALMRDLRLSARHFRDVDKEAVVTDIKWIRRLARIGNVLPGVAVRRFSGHDKDEALRWISE
jgi:hypothetical protein